MKEILYLFNNKKYKEIMNFHIKDIAVKLGFKDSMILAYKLLYNDEWDENLQEFAVQLIYALREEFSQEWIADWRYDAFLGLACDITLKYDERYEAYKQATEKSPSPPAELLIELACCCYCPGTPPLSYDQAIKLLKRSIEQHPYKQAAALLKAIYVSKGDKINENYWSKMMNEIKDEKIPPLEPAFLRRCSTAL